MWEREGDSNWLLCEKGVILLWELMGASCVSGLGYGLKVRPGKDGEMEDGGMEQEEEAAQSGSYGLWGEIKR